MPQTATPRPKGRPALELEHVFDDPTKEARRKRLIAIRKALDLNLTEFAPMIAVNPVSLSRLERGKHAVSETRIMLAEMVYKANR